MKTADSVLLSLFMRDSGRCNIPHAAWSRVKRYYAIKKLVNPSPKGPEKVKNILTPEFYGDLVYKFKKIIGNPNFSNLLKRIVNRFKRAGYSLDIMRQTASLVFNPIIVEGYAALFSCTAVVQASDSMTASM